MFNLKTSIMKNQVTKGKKQLEVLTSGQLVKIKGGDGEAEDMYPSPQ